MDVVDAVDDMEMGDTPYRRPAHLAQHSWALPSVRVLVTLIRHRFVRSRYSWRIVDAVEDWARSTTADAVTVHSRQFVALVLLATLRLAVATFVDAVIFGGTVATFVVTIGGMVLCIVDYCPMPVVGAPAAVVYMRLVVEPPLLGSYAVVHRRLSDHVAFVDPIAGSLGGRVEFDVAILMTVDVDLAKHSPYASYWDVVAAPEHALSLPIVAVDLLAVEQDSVVVVVPLRHVPPPVPDDVIDFVNESVDSLHGPVAVVTGAPLDSDDVASVAEMICGSD